MELHLVLLVEQLHDLVLSLPPGLAYQVIVDALEGLLVLDYLVQQHSQVPGVYLLNRRELHLLLEEQARAVVAVANLVAEGQLPDDWLETDSVKEDAETHDEFELLSQEEVLGTYLLEVDLTFPEISKDLVEFTQKVGNFELSESLSFVHQITEEVLIALGNDEDGVRLVDDF